MKFICDDNLGKLSKYLRILGFDTCFREPLDDSALLRIASEEERLILTRDNKLAARTVPFGIMVICGDNPLDQLTGAISSLDLSIDPELLFARCSRCNSRCKTADKSEIQDKVFPYILKTHEIIKKCPDCGRYYWKGSHYKALLIKLRKAIPSGNLAGNWPDP